MQILSIVFVILFAISNALQGVSASEPTTAAQARTVIDLRVDFPGAAPVTLRVAAGDRATVRTVDGVFLGLTPDLRDDSIRLRVSDVQPDGTAHDIQTLALARSQPEIVSSQSFSLIVEWTGAFEATADPSQGPCQTCCVVCNDITYCACFVITVCGECCCSHACQCGSVPECTTPASRHLGR